MKFKKYALSQLVTIKYGKNQKKVVSSEASIPIYGTGGLMGYATMCLYDKPSVLIGRKGTIGKVKYVEHPFWTVDTLFYTIVNTDIVIPKFLYYVMSQVDFNNYNEGTTIPSLRTETLYKLEFNIPPLDEQRRILSMLNPIEELMELNAHKNNNLEHLAQAIFKAWFVDFEPFGGCKPNDWITYSLGELCSCELGGTPSRNNHEYWNGNIPWINSGEVNHFRVTKPSEYISELGLAKSATKLLPAKTTVIAITGATLGQISLLEIESCTNQSVIGVKQNDNMPYEFIYPFIKENISILLSHQTGGAQQHINKQNVESLDVTIPTPQIMKAYTNIVEPLYSLITSNCFEIVYLSDLLNSLLPKLMSGEIDVSDFEI